MSPAIGENLLGIPETLLPENPDLVARYEAGDEGEDLARAFPAESFPWALMADDAWSEGREVESYAFARVGYHRGLDALRKAGWRGQGPVPWSHEPNRGFLRALYALQRAAAAIGEADEVDRIGAFLRDSDASAVAAIEAGE